MLTYVEAPGGSGVRRPQVENGDALAAGKTRAGCARSRWRCSAMMGEAPGARKRCARWRPLRAVTGFVLVLGCVVAASSPGLSAPPAPRIPALPTIGVPGTAPIEVVVNGATVRFDVPPMMYDGGVYVPLRGVFEKIGARVDFQPSTGLVTATRGATTVELTVGNTLAKVNGQTTVMLTPAVEVHGRTLVPLRFLGEALGASVDWNPVTHEVSITAPAINHTKGRHVHA